MKLYHYYESKNGPFKNLSDLNIGEEEKILNKIKENKNIFASKRDDEYMKRRFEYEDRVRKLFQRKNGKVIRQRPHYMTLGECDWLKDWYVDTKEISIEVDMIDKSSISFTYGDMFPVFGPNGDNSAWYRKKVYTYAEILEKIKIYGLPQKNNPYGNNGPIRYIEAQIWDDEVITYICNKSEKLHGR